MKYKRIFLIVYDSLGVGNDPRAKEFNDLGSNTFKSINDLKRVNAPVLIKLGVKALSYQEKTNELGYAFRAYEKSNAKDTMAGHWEMTGIVTEKPFPIFTKSGFPKELLKKIEDKFKLEVVGNKSASGTEILKEFANQEIKQNKLIVYTSADSVMQICGHEKIMGLKKLYEICEFSRKVCSSNPSWNVGRIIARPYIGRDNFERTSNRRDYAIAPSHKTTLDFLKENNFDVIAIGKISDIFCGKGISKSIKTTSDSHGFQETLKLIEANNINGIVFTNLVDFDAKFGHRRDVDGYRQNLEEMDQYLDKAIKKLKNDDLLMVVGDHGNDPTWKGTDHTRESIPILAFSPSMTNNGVLRPRNTFADIGATICENFGVKNKNIGESFLKHLK